MVFHGKTVSTKQKQTATPAAGSHSLPTQLSLQPEQLKYFFPTDREGEKILEIQLCLVKHICQNVSMVTEDHRGGKKKQCTKNPLDAKGQTYGTVCISTLTTAAFQRVSAYVLCYVLPRQYIQRGQWPEEKYHGIN